MAVSISISITQNSQSVIENTSNVTVKVTAKWTGGSYNKNSPSGWCKINGTKYTFSSSFNTGQTTSGSKVIYSKTLNIPHNADGTKTLYCSASFSTGVSSGTVTASKSKVLTDISRATIPSFNYDGAVCYLGDAVTINFIRFESDGNSGYTHTLEVAFGEITEVIGTGIAENDAITWVVPISYARQIPNSTSGILIFTCHTYNGEELIGTYSVNVAAYLPERIVSTAHIKHEEANTNVSDVFGAYLKGESRLKVDVTGVGAFDSTITSYKVEVDGASYSGESIETELLKTSGIVPITATVIDSRGRTGTTTEEIVVHDYSPPVISALEAERCKSATDGTEDLEGVHVNVHLVASVTALEGNALTYTVFYKKANETEEVSQTFNPSGYAVDVENILGIIEGESAYEFRVVVTDALGRTTEKTVEVGTAAPTVDYHHTGKGISFGKVSEEEGVADFAMTIKPREGFVLLEIPEETDFNDLKTPNVFVGNNATESRYLNCPVSEGAFTLEIIGSGDVILQRVSVLSKVNMETWQRVFSEGSWGEWLGSSQSTNSGYEPSFIKVYRTTDVTNLSTSYNYFDPLTGANGHAVDMQQGNLSQVSQTITTFGDRSNYAVQGVLIGKDIHKVRVTANVSHANQTSYYFFMKTLICMVRDGTVIGLAANGQRMHEEEQIVHNLSAILEVTEGDFICLMGYKGVASRQVDVQASVNSHPKMTHLCVEAIG